MTAPLCFVDTETDGVHPGRKPWEIALIRRDENGQTTASFFVEINLRTADPFGLKVGRFYERHPMGKAIAKPGIGPVLRVVDGDYYTTEKAARTVARMTHGAHLVGAVPHFDAHVFDRLLRGHGLIPSWHYHLIDVEALAVGYLAGQGHAALELPWRSDDLMAVIGVEPPAEDERHTALGDAQWAMRAYDLITGDNNE